MLDKTYSLGLIRSDLMEYIDKHPYFPDHVKEETKQVVANHFNCIGQYLGLLELTFRRTYEHKDQIDPQRQVYEKTIE